MKLDKSKPYGQISGEHSAMFEQDGAFFDANFDEVKDARDEGIGDFVDTQEQTPSAPKAARSPKASASKPDTPTDDQVAAQLGS